MSNVATIQVDDMNSLMAIETEEEKAMDYEHSRIEIIDDLKESNDRRSMPKTSKDINLFTKLRKHESPNQKMGSGLIGQRMS